MFGKNKQTRWVVLLLGLLALTLWQCDHSDTANVTPSQEEIPEQEGWNSTVTVTKSGRPSAIIRYGHMQKFRNKRITTFGNGITVDFFDKDGRQTSMLTADSGVMRDVTSEFEAMGNVIVITEDGRSLRTEKLRWDHRRQRIISEVLTMFATTTGDTLVGEGFESDQSLHHWQISKPKGVTGRAYSPALLDETPPDSVPQ